LEEEEEEEGEEGLEAVALIGSSASRCRRMAFDPETGKPANLQCSLSSATVARRLVLEDLLIRGGIERNDKKCGALASRIVIFNTARIMCI